MIRNSHFLIALAIVAGSVAGTPTSAEPIFPGSNALQTGSLQTGTDTTESYRVENGTRYPIATITRTVSRERRGSRPVYRVIIRNQSSRGDSSRSETIVDARTYAMISQTVHGTADSGEVTCANGRAKGWVKAANDSLRNLDVKTDSLTFPDDGALPWLVSSLPLAVGKSFELRSFKMWAGREVPLNFAVVREDTIRYQGRLDTCWAVHAAGEGGPPGFDYLNWVSKRSRQLLQAAFLKSDPSTQFWIKRR